MNEIVNRIVNFKNSDTTKKLKEYYSTSSLMEIYGINRKETRHTAFLKWLFSSDCKVANAALKRFIDILLTSSHYKDEIIGKELYNLLLIGRYDIESLVSEENKNTTDGLIDLIVDARINNFKLQLIIENKINSEEFTKQTQRYFNAQKSVNNDVEQIFIYLTPISSISLGELIEPECECKNYIHINYQILVDQIIEPLLNEELDKATAYILEDYLKALSVPLYSKPNKYNIMAISNRESELLLKFWEENEELILKAVEATKDNYHIEPDTREKARKVNEIVDYKLDKVGSYVKRTLINLFNEGKITNEEIQSFQDAEYSKKTFDIQFPLLKKKESEFEKPQRYWKDSISIGNEEYFMCCEWYENANNNDKIFFDKWLSKFN